MPDETFKTVSATQVPALWNRSPYSTRFMLWHQFANKELEGPREDNRMKWGKIMQPHLLQTASDDLKYEVEPFEDYVRRSPVGCTKDAIIRSPDQGPGALETKVCFDYKVWMERWSGGDRPPEDIEIQLQIQMAVGDGKTPYKWGVIAVWLAGDMYYFEREPSKELWARVWTDADQFLLDVEGGEPPDPFGETMELELLTKLYPAVEDKVKDLSEPTADNLALAETARMYGWAKAKKSEFTKMEKELKPKIVAIAEDHDKIALPETMAFVNKSKPNKSTGSISTSVDVIETDAVPFDPERGVELMG